MGTDEPGLWTPHLLSAFYDLSLLTFFLVCFWLRHCGNNISPKLDLPLLCVLSSCNQSSKGSLRIRPCRSRWSLTTELLKWRSCLSQTSQTVLEDGTQQLGGQTMLSQLRCIYKTLRIAFKMCSFHAVNTASGVHRSCPDSMCESLFTGVTTLFVHNFCCIVLLWGRIGPSHFILVATYSRYVLALTLRVKAPWTYW